MRVTACFVMALLAGCSAKPDKAPERPVDAVAPDVTASPATAVAADQVVAGVAPLRSAAVQAAIHRALRTGRNQRWQDGSRSGYAVPSLATMANGCRTIRYTIDQQPDAPPMTINACDAGQP
jgi:hypothetical protein